MPRLTARSFPSVRAMSSPYALTSVVFPKPAGAEMSVILRRRPSLSLRLPGPGSEQWRDLLQQAHNLV
jgi:hypothetical protein